MNYIENNGVSIRIIGRSEIDFDLLEEKLPFSFIKHRKGDVLYKKYTVENDVAVMNLEF